VLGLLLARALGLGARLERPPGEAVFVRLAALWHVVPILALFLVSSLAATSVFVPRYLLCTAPGFALLAAWAARALAPAAVRGLVAAAVVLASATHAESRLDDWRSAAVTARAELRGDRTPVLVPTVFIEGRQLEWLDDPEKRSYLLAPFSFYPVEGELVVLPCTFAGKSLDMAEGAATRLAGAERILLVAQPGHGLVPWLAWRLGREGLEARAIDCGTPSVYVFERAKPR